MESGIKADIFCLLSMKFQKMRNKLALFCNVKEAVINLLMRLQFMRFQI
jgi:hypothetical protein